MNQGVMAMERGFLLSPLELQNWSLTTGAGLFYSQDTPLIVIVRGGGYYSITEELVSIF